MSQLQDLTFRERSGIVPQLEALDAQIQREEEASMELGWEDTNEEQELPCDHDSEDNESRRHAHRSRSTVQYKDQSRSFASIVPLADAVVVSDSLFVTEDGPLLLFGSGDHAHQVENTMSTITDDDADDALPSAAAERILAVSSEDDDGHCNSLALSSLSSSSRVYTEHKDRERRRIPPRDPSGIRLVGND